MLAALRSAIASHLAVTVRIRQAISQRKKLSLGKCHHACAAAAQQHGIGCQAGHGGSSFWHPLVRQSLR